MGFQHVKSIFGFIISDPDPQEIDYVGGDLGAMVDMADEVWCCWQNFFAQIFSGIRRYFFSFLAHMGPFQTPEWAAINQYIIFNSWDQYSKGWKIDT